MTRSPSPSTSATAPVSAPRPRGLRPGRWVVGVLALALVAAACGNDDDGGAAPAEPVTGPATISAVDQTTDGTVVTVASVELPTPGFVVIHADADGAPGPILGWSDLLPAGVSENVEVTLNEPLEADATVWPMAHVDADGDGTYEFMPPDVTVDVPATTADGEIAVVPVVCTVTAAGSGDTGMGG